MASRSVSPKTSLVAVPLGTLPKFCDVAVWFVDRLAAGTVRELPATVWAWAESAEAAMMSNSSCEMPSIVLGMTFTGSTPSLCSLYGLPFAARCFEICEKHGCGQKAAGEKLRQVLDLEKDKQNKVEPSLTPVRDRAMCVG